MENNLSKRRKTSVETPSITIRPRTENQKRYIEAIDNNNVIFCTGVAGTGKTRIAVSKALEYFFNRDNTINKIIVSRPLAQAGENTGYLPGNIGEKMEPYLKPIYDEMLYYVTPPEIQDYIKHECIDICPFSFMRGRNFVNAFVVVDEAQNCTKEQLKLLLTRICENTKMIITGDITQCDLPKHLKGGLEFCSQLEVHGVTHVHMEYSDIVRSRVVKDILKDWNRLERT